MLRTLHPGRAWTALPKGRPLRPRANVRPFADSCRASGTGAKPMRHILQQPHRAPCSTKALQQTPPQPAQTKSPLFGEARGHRPSHRPTARRPSQQGLERVPTHQRASSAEKPSSCYPRSHSMRNWLVCSRRRRKVGNRPQAGCTPQSRRHPDHPEDTRRSAPPCCSRAQPLPAAPAGPCRPHLRSPTGASPNPRRSSRVCRTPAGARRWTPAVLA
mmetsp:Transcript_23986/g.74649  ORF Transcript_23986/g.74649 Transcript_23986/m.74649 type:complete len:216 (-) Transcript_23986:1006-1653(-)